MLWCNEMVSKRHFRVIKRKIYIVTSEFMTAPAFKNPKQRHKNAELAPTLSGYNYYAGYSSPFVNSVFDEFQMADGAFVLDPWNGSGTTTRVAKSRKINGIGFDLNPATLVIARAGLIDWNTIGGSVKPLSQHLLDLTQQALSCRHPKPRGGSDPLNQWFAPATSGVLRTMELTVRATFVGLSSAQTTQFSPLAAFFYLALFKTVRVLCKDFGTSNPTWIKTAKTPEDHLKISSADIYATFTNAVSELSHAFAEWESHQVKNSHKNSKQLPLSEIRLDIADARALPMADKSVDAVVTSPPYCTRLDYVVATLPELAVIGVSLAEAENLKRRLIGTTKVPPTLPAFQAEWGEECRRLLHNIEVHPSHASATYYLKWAAQYFESLYDSFVEINRVLKPGSPCAIVVQDSNYKEVKIELPNIVCQMTGSMQWQYEGKASCIEKNTMAAANPKTKVYRDNNNAEECVLVFRTPKK